MYLGKNYLQRFQLLLHLLVLGLQNLFLFFVNFPLGLQALLQFDVGNLRNDTISHRLLKHAKIIKHTGETHSFSIKLAIQLPKCEWIEKAFNILLHILSYLLLEVQAVWWLLHTNKARLWANIPFYMASTTQHFPDMQVEYKHTSYAHIKNECSYASTPTIRFIGW